MNTPVKLFLSRIIDDWKFQYDVWKTVVDWTVLLYILVPLVIVTIRQYIIIWQATPGWLDILPYDLVFGIAFLSAWKGLPRLFIEEADQLFLKRKDIWYGGIIKMSIMYFFWRSLFVSVLFFIIVTPVLLKGYEVTWYQIFLFFTLTLCTKLNLGLVKQMLALRFHGFRQKLVQIAIFILAGFLFRILVPIAIKDRLLFLSIFVILVIICLMLAYKRISLKGMFFEDWAQAMEQKLKYVSIIMGLSGQKVKRPGARRKRPLLFRNSNALFKQRSAASSLVEFGLKSFIRNKGAVILYLQVILFGTLFVLPLPFPWPFLALLAVAFLLASLVRLHWVDEINSEFIRLLPWQEAHKMIAAEKFIFLTTLPGFLILSFFVGLKAFSWIGVILLLPISTLFLRYLVQKMILYATI